MKITKPLDPTAVLDACQESCQDANLKQEAKWLKDRIERRKIIANLSPTLFFWQPFAGYYIPTDEQNRVALEEMTGLSALTLDQFMYWSMENGYNVQFRVRDNEIELLRETVSKMRNEATEERKRSELLYALLPYGFMGVARTVQVLDESRQDVDDFAEYVTKYCKEIEVQLPDVDIVCAAYQYICGKADVPELDVYGNSICTAFDTDVDKAAEILHAIDEDDRNEAFDWIVKEIECADELAALDQGELDEHGWPVAYDEFTEEETGNDGTLYRSVVNRDGDFEEWIKLPEKAWTKVDTD